MPSYKSDSVVEFQEERIQRLESGMQTVATTTALTDQKLDHLADTVKEGFMNINERLDRGAAQFDQQAADISKTKADVAQLQAAEHGRSRRWMSIKRAALPILAAAAGVIATKGGESLWTIVLAHLTRH